MMNECTILILNPLYMVLNFFNVLNLNKSCISLTNPKNDCKFCFFQTCLNKLVGVCHSQDEVNKIKDEQLEDSLKHVKANIPNWDSDKCPAMK